MPTITIGNRGGETFSGMQDALLVDADANGNYSAEAASGGWPAFLLRPDLSGIPGGSTITDAFWTLGVSSGQPTGSITVNRALRAWVETQASWNNYSTGNAWTTAGALSDGNDKSATDSCTMTYPGGFSTADVVSTGNAQLIADIQAMIDGSFGLNGWRFGVVTVSMGLPNHGTAAKRPFLTVTYTSGSGGTNPARNLSLLGVG